MKRINLTTKPKIIKNDTVNTINFVFLFPCEYNRKDVFNLEIARIFIDTSSKNFPNEKDFYQKNTENLIISWNFGYERIGDKLYIKINFKVPKEGLISDYSLEKSFAFFIDVIFNPFAEDGKFNEEKFANEKEFLMTRQIDRNRGIYNISFNKFTKFLDPDEEIFLSPESRSEYYEKLDAKEAYDTYKKCVLDNKFISYVYGNIEEERVNEIFKKYLPRNIEDIEIDIKPEKYLQMCEYAYLEESANFNQSALYMAYLIKDFDTSDIEYISLIGNILSNQGSDLIFKTLRMDNNLIYSSHVLKFINNGFFVIETYLSNDAKDLAIELVNKTIDSLKNREFLENNIQILLRGMEIAALREEDNNSNKLDNIISQDFNWRYLKSIIEAYQEMNIDDILAFLDRIELNKVFFLRGEKND